MCHPSHLRGIMASNITQHKHIGQTMGAVQPLDRHIQQVRETTTLVYSSKWFLKPVKHSIVTALDVNIGSP